MVSMCWPLWRKPPLPGQVSAMEKSYPAKSLPIFTTSKMEDRRLTARDSALDGDLPLGGGDSILPD